MAETPKRTALHDELDVFLGRWRHEGTSYGEGQDPGAPKANGVPWTSDETYEWLPGEFFMLHRFDAKAGGGTLQGAEILGCDARGTHRFARMFENHGYAVAYDVSRDGDTWTFSGEGQRATYRFNGAGDAIDILWEWRHDGSDWLPLCERTARRVSR